MLRGINSLARDCAVIKRLKFLDIYKIDKTVKSTCKVVIVMASKKMDKNKAFMLQRQVKENSEDLHKEILDMQAWEEQMKKKDFEIRNSKNDRTIPPVRTKKKKAETICTEESTDEKPSKTQRIKGGDYKSWEKFDAEKACKDVEQKNQNNQKAKVEFEIPTEEELEKEHNEANKLKDEGNALVKEKEYAKAIGKYSQAIKIFPSDAAFYVNRALCQLKIDNLYSAESDCTEAIKLNSNYVKAYYRRATARVELKRYDEAKKDLEVVLELDPSNKEAKSMLSQVLKKIEKLPKPLIISGNEKDDKTSIEKKIGEKLFPKKANENTKSENPIKVEQCNTSEIASTSEQDSVIKIDVKMNKKENPYLEEIQKAQNKIKPKKVEGDGLPSWLPKLKEGIQFVETSTENSSRKKQSLRRIQIIEEIPANESIFSEIQEVEIKVEKSSDIKEKIPVSDNSSILENKSDKEVSPKSIIQNEDLESVPCPPKSSVSFLLTWRKNTSPDFRYKYLKQIPPKDIPDIFKESMESNIFSEILCILSTKFILNEDKVFDYLHYLAKLKRFRALVLFLSAADKDAIKNLFEYSKSKEGKDFEELKELRSSYEM